jgi:hypothetical protein
MQGHVTAMLPAGCYHGVGVGDVDDFIGVWMLPR